MIQVNRLTKYYGPTRALDGLSFDVPEGEILGFLGPNGAGKTTTMRILTGLAMPSGGTARVGGFDVSRQYRNVHRLLGYLPEEAPLYGEMTVRSYLRFVAGMKLAGRRDGNYQVDRAMEETGLLKVDRRLVGNLSKGMRQRVGLAQALLGDPRVLVLDEPTVGLDPSQISEIRQLIRSMKGRRTVILSTHILPEVAMTCTRVVILNQGRIVTQGPLAEIGKQSAERRVRVHVQGHSYTAAELLREAAPEATVEIIPDGPKDEAHLRVRWVGRHGVARPARGGGDAGGSVPAGDQCSGGKSGDGVMMASIRQTWLVFLRDLRSLFATPLFWVLSGVFFLASSLVFVGLIFGFANQQFAHDNDVNANITIGVITQLFHVIHFFLLVQIPLLTMRAFAEERRQGTLALLRTTPVSEWSLVLGKFLANGAAMIIYLALTLAFPAIVTWISDPEWAVVGTCYGALVLAALAYVALGIFFSSLTESQVVAAVLTYVAIFMLLIVSSLLEAFPTPEFAQLAQHLTVIGHIEGFLAGSVAPVDGAYFVLLAFLFLFFAVRQLESLRWRT